ncbi:MAG: hypothetical protein V1918_05275 [Planctomycetota bacterium]
MDNPIDKAFYVDHNGKRIYACCATCLVEIKKNPAKFVTLLEEQGIAIERVPVAICTNCGEIKGPGHVCNFEGKEICEKCGLIKGSPGDCKVQKGAEGEFYLYPDGTVKTAPVVEEEAGQEPAAASTPEQVEPAK